MRRDDGSAGPTGCVGNDGTTGASACATGPSIPSPADGSITAELARRSGQGVTPAQGCALRSAQGSMAGTETMIRKQQTFLCPIAAHQDGRRRGGWA